MQALEALKRSRYDLVLMDCQMPEMDGFTAVGEIRRRETSGTRFVAHGAIPVIALTANAVRGDRELCLAAGMTDYVSKPIDRQLLLSTIGRLLAAAPAATIAEAAPTTNIIDACDATDVADLAFEEAIAAEAAAVADLARAAMGREPAGKTTEDQAAATRGIEGDIESKLEATVAEIVAAFKTEDLLTRCQGDRKFAGRVLAKFERRLPDDLLALEQAAAARDCDAIKRHAHQLKGCAGNVGAMRLGACAAVLETQAAQSIIAEENLVLLRTEVGYCLNEIGGLTAEFSQA